MGYDTFMRILKSDLIKVEKLLHRDDFLACDELSEIIEEEVKQLIEVMQAPQPHDDYFSAKSKAEKLTVLVNRAQELASESEGFLRSLKLAVKRSDPEKLAPWRDGVKHLIAEAHRWPDLQETPPGSEVTKEVVSLGWKSEFGYAVTSHPWNTCCADYRLVRYQDSKLGSNEGASRRQPPRYIT